MFVRGGVYRVVKEALGGTLAKISVSALMFDYILTGPISGVSAGQYIAGLINDTFATADAHGWVPRAMHNMFHGTPHVDVNWTSVVFAVIVTVYFWWQNTKGIQESSEKALRVMQITTVMVVILLGWSALDPVEAGIPVGPAAHRRQPEVQRGSAGLPEAHRPGPGSGHEVRHPRHPDRLRPLRAGHERRGIAGPGQSRTGSSQAEEPEARRHHHRGLQLRLHRTHRAAVRDDHSGLGAHPGLQGQPDRRAGHVSVRARCCCGCFSALSSWWWVS